jgi:hypothetical protein
MTAGTSGTAQAFQAVDWRATALLPGRGCSREWTGADRRRIQRRIPAASDSTIRRDWTTEAAAAHDPVQPTLVGARGTCSHLGVAVAQLGDREGAAANELVEPFIAECSRDVVGVLGLKADQS